MNAKTAKKISKIKDKSIRNHLKKLYNGLNDNERNHFKKSIHKIIAKYEPLLK